MVGSRAAAHLDRGRPDWTVMDGLGQGLESGVRRAPLVSGGSGSCPDARRRVRRVGWMGTHNVTQELSVGGGVAALLFSYIFSRYLWLHPLDQVLTNRSGPRGAAPAGLS